MTAEDGSFPMLEMTADQFRRHGHAAVEMAAAYLEVVPDLPPLAPVEPGWLAEQLPAMAPAQGESMERILADFESLIVPATTHWNHPRFFAYFNSSGGRRRDHRRALERGHECQCHALAHRPVRNRAGVGCLPLAEPDAGSTADL